MPKKLLDLLVASGAVTAEDAVAVRKEAAKKNVTPEDILLERGFDEDALVQAKGQALDMPIFSLQGRKVPFELLKAIPEESARHYQFVPLGVEEGTLLIGIEPRQY